MNALAAKFRALSTSPCSFSYPPPPPNLRTSTWLGLLRVPVKKSCSSGYSLLLQWKPEVTSLHILASLPPMASTEADDDISVSHVKIADSSRTVHVKFVLQKECLFGQQFLLVGDDPMLGCWDPEKAIPLDWSEGHIWTAAMDLPVGKKVEFKFILREPSGKIDWQPGPDRVLQICYSTKTITVFEDWNKVENQKIIEEEPLAILIDDELSAEGKTCINGSVWNKVDYQEIIEEPLAILTDEELSDEGKTCSNESFLVDRTSMVGTQETQDMLDARISQTICDKKLTDPDSNLLLVPGLTVISDSGKASDCLENLAAEYIVNTPLPSNEAKECISVQLLGKEEKPGLEEKPDGPSGNLPEEEKMKSSQLISDDCDGAPSHVFQEETFPSKEANSQTTVRIIRNDIKWGHRAIGQLLFNLGFKTSPTETS